MLEFHVWGPACGLPSIDAESLALITYASHALPASEWTLVATSPSAIPSHVLPALFDQTSGSWISGYRAIVSHLASSSSYRDLDADLTPAQRADADALAAFLSSKAAPLAALSLYASHVNWSEAVRPAYSRILPFPLAWVEPPLVRDAMVRRAEALGLDDLDPDAEVPPETQKQQQQQQQPAAAKGGLKKITDYLGPRYGSKEHISEEKRAISNLNATARTVLAPLAQALQARQSFVADEAAQPTSIDCLAYAYLSLMLVPSLPRPWLRTLLTTDTTLTPLPSFVERIRAATGAALSADSSSIWRTEDVSSSSSSRPYLLTRFLGSTLRNAPYAGPAFHVWDVERRRPAYSARRDVLVAFCAAVLGSALVGGVLAWRRMPAFGEAVYRWKQPVRGFGAAGALLGLGVGAGAGVGVGGGGGGGGGGAGMGSGEDQGIRAPTPQGYSGKMGGAGVGGGYEEVPIEMSGRPEVVEVGVEVDARRRD